MYVYTYRCIHTHIFKYMYMEIHRKIKKANMAKYYGGSLYFFSLSVRLTFFIFYFYNFMKLTWKRN